MTEPRRKLRFLIILSGWVENDGLRELDNLPRIERAIKLWFDAIKNGLAYDFLMPSGGIFTPGQTTASANMFREFLKRAGVSAGQIVCETGSLDTFGNFRCLKQILSLNFANSDRELTIVTEQLHARRARLICEAYGLTARFETVFAPLPLWERLREKIYLLYTYYDPKGIKFGARFMRWKRLNSRS